MASLLLAKTSCRIAVRSPQFPVLYASKLGNFIRSRPTQHVLRNVTFRRTLASCRKSLKLFPISAKHVPSTGLTLAFISPLSYFRRNKEIDPSHEDQALAQIPKEVFKKDVLVKRKKRNIIMRIFFKIWSTIRITCRILRLGLTFGPLLCTYPLTCVSERFRRRWLKWAFWACETSGPTFIKFGQWAGARRDLFSEEFCDLFSDLHTKVKPHSWFTTRRKLRKAFGKNWAKIFVAVDRKPIGSGCIAQVHKGYMRQGMIPDESVIEDALEDDEVASEVEFAEGLEIIGFGHVIDSALGSSDQLEYEESWRWWRQRGVPLPNTKPPKSMISNDEPGLVSEDKPSEVETISPTVTNSQGVSPNLAKDAGNNDEEEVQLVPVAIKVLHPGVFRLFRRDIAILRLAAKVAEFLIPSLKWLSLSECVDEFEILMKKQVDLRFEANTLEKFVDNFADNPNVRFPRPVRPYCKRDVLVETYEEGELISHFINADDASSSLKETLASYGLDALLQMVFVDNLVHGDLHPGNILVQNAQDFVPQEENKLVMVDLCDTVVVNVCPAEVPVRLVMLDVGIATSLSPSDLNNFRSVFAAVVVGDGEKVADLMLTHSSYNKCKDVEAFKHDLGHIVIEARKNTIKLGKIDVADLFSKVFGVMSRHHVKMESSFASVMIAIFVLEGLGRSLDPELDILERAKPILLS